MELIKNGFEVTENIDETQCIVLGFDTELNFKKLEDICKILSTRQVPYIATNPDYVCPTEFGSVPDCGSVADMIFNATGKRPLFRALLRKISAKKLDTTARKPAPSIAHAACSRLEPQPKFLPATKISPP